MFGCNVKYKNGENKVQIKGKEKKWTEKCKEYRKKQPNELKNKRIQK